MKTTPKWRAAAAIPLLLPVIVSACASSPPEAPAAPARNRLAGTTWQLVEFQSSSDDVGTLRPDDPSRYTMQLLEDGTVAMRLNCNRAFGTWSAALAGGDAGGFEFGPLVTTRAACAPPSMDERVARDAQYVRSFLLRDGRLYLSLMADGGIYAWEPVD
jgi:heat shock protein HslJ